MTPILQLENQTCTDRGGVGVVVKDAAGVGQFLFKVIAFVTVGSAQEPFPEDVTDTGAEIITVADLGEIVGFTVREFRLEVGEFLVVADKAGLNEDFALGTEGHFAKAGVADGNQITHVSGTVSGGTGGNAGTLGGSWRNGVGEAARIGDKGTHEIADVESRAERDVFDADGDIHVAEHVGSIVIGAAPGLTTDYDETSRGLCRRTADDHGAAPAVLKSFVAGVVAELVDDRTSFDEDDAGLGEGISGGQGQKTQRT